MPGPRSLNLRTESSTPTGLSWKKSKAFILGAPLRYALASGSKELSRSQAPPARINSCPDTNQRRIVPKFFSIVFIGSNKRLLLNEKNQISHRRRLHDRRSRLRSSIIWKRAFSRRYNGLHLRVCAHKEAVEKTFW